MDDLWRRAQRDATTGFDPWGEGRAHRYSVRAGYLAEQQAILETIAREIKNNPLALCKLLNWEPTYQQRAVLDDVAAGYPKIAVKAGRGVGKTALGGVVAYWRMLRAKNSLVILTAPSMKQCSDVFINEMRLILSRADPILKSIFKFTTRKVFVGECGKDDSNEPHWGLMAVTGADPVNLQGFHCESLTVIEDEASGTDRAFVGAIEGTMTQATGDRLHLQQGNPNYRDSGFFDSFHRKRKFFRCHTLSAAESPLVSKDWVNYMRESFGAESPVCKVHVDGEFPGMDPNAIMSIEDLEACTKTNREELFHVGDRKQFGIDLARFGGDESTIYQVMGMAVFAWEIHHMKEPEDVVARSFVMQEGSDWTDKQTDYVADADGLGQGVMASFRKAGKRLLEFHTQGRPYNTKMFANRMTEAWFSFARLVKARSVWIPDDPILLQQLSTRLYSLDPKGKLRVESKDDYKKRMKSETLESTDSPDRADGVIMAFYENRGPAQVTFG